MYTTIRHNFKIALDLTDQEYCVADIIYRLSTNPGAPVLGWCIMDKSDMGIALGYKPRSLSRYISSLRSRGYVVSTQDGKRCKTTDLYNQKRSEFDQKEVLKTASHPHANMATSTPIWRTPHANMADYNRVRIEIYSLLSDQAKKSNLPERFSELNLAELERARHIFVANYLEGRYGHLVHEAIVARFVKFLDSWMANKAPGPSSAGAPKKEKNLSDESRY